MVVDNPFNPTPHSHTRLGVLFTNRQREEGRDERQEKVWTRAPVGWKSNGGGGRGCCLQKKKEGASIITVTSAAEADRIDDRTRRVVVVVVVVVAVVVVVVPGFSPFEMLNATAPIVETIWPGSLQSTRQIPLSGSSGGSSGSGGGRSSRNRRRRRVRKTGKREL